MYSVRDIWSHMCQVGNWKEKRVCPMYTVGDTCPKWATGEEKRISGMYSVEDAQ